MTEPSRPRPVPGPPRPGPPGAPVAAAVRPAGAVGVTPPSVRDDEGSSAAVSPADLDRRPVTEHVAVFEAEHDRLQRELATIDQL